MLPSLTSYTMAEILSMDTANRTELARQLANYRPYVDELGEGTEVREALDFARWLRSIEKPMRGATLPGYHAFQEMALRADRALGRTLNNLRATGMLAAKGQNGTSEDCPPPLSWYGITQNNIPRYARFLGGLDQETFDAALSRASADRNLSAAHVQRILNGEDGGAHTKRVAKVTEFAAQGLSSYDMAQRLGFRDGHNVRQLARRYDIDIPGDRTSAAQIKSRAILRSTDGFTERNYYGLANALSALDHVMTEAAGQLHPDITSDQATAWSKELRRGRTQLTRLIHVLEEAATP